ncbi:MAG: hypothetical protein GY702_25495, partial [Desulfobulbaceae bacterium]|nr:hypothetical protein [Desulfobulbaceae bacterium]
MVIAEVEVPAVLGYDFLKASGAVLDICTQKLMLNGRPLDCVLESRLPSLFRISISETVTIPARSEMMVKAELRSEDGSVNGKGIPVCVETKPSFFQKTGLLVARCLVNSGAKTVPVRLMNAGDEARVIYKSTTAAMAEPVIETADAVRGLDSTKNCELP